MTVAIIIFLILSIIGYGSITINGTKYSINWFAIVALILYIISII